LISPDAISLNLSGKVVTKGEEHKASAIGFATMPSRDEGGLSLAAVNRMIAGAIRGVKAREHQRR
jgi:hypothetical protein